VIIISSELDEIYALSDRIAVMYEGKITGFRPPTVPVAELGLLMAGGGNGDKPADGGTPGATAVPADSAVAAGNPAIGGGPVVSSDTAVEVDPADGASSQDGQGEPA
jgi:hypothetical protein